MWVLFTALLFPVGFAGWAVGHYTSLGTSGGTTTVTRTVTAGSAAPTTTAPTMGAAGAGATTGATATGPGATTGNAAAGKAVFVSAGCGVCHAFKPVGAAATVGPDLDTKPKADAAKAGMPLTAFLRQSIVDPNAYVSPGYPKGVMPQTYAAQLSQAQLENLVAFLASG